MLFLEEVMYQQGVSSNALIQRVGVALGERLAAMVQIPSTHNVAILVGPGNNGADGLAAALYLSDNGLSVHVYLCADKAHQDYELIRQLGYGIGYTDLVQNLPDNFEEEIGQFDIVVDAIFGISKPREIEGLIASVLKSVRASFTNDRRRFLVAVDIPSGMDADTGAVDDVTVPVTYTLAVGYPKRGCFLNPGYQYVGIIESLDIGLRSDVLDTIHSNLTGLEDFQSAGDSLNLAADSHKGSKGHVLVIAGSFSYPGAAILAAKAAYRSGCGVVTLASPASIFPVIAGQLPEAIHLTYPDLMSDEATNEAITLVCNLEIGKYDSVVVGCGLGRGNFPSRFVNEVIHFFGKKGESIPIVVDADGLNCLAHIDSWWKNLERTLVLTPHPGEMGRLMNIPVEAVQRVRSDTAIALATKVNQTTVLKGAFTVVADVQGSTYVNPHANPVLATAGSGDVLAGLIASLLAQQLPELLAVRFGVYIHGEAGEYLRDRVGDRGVIASDIVEYLPRVINGLLV
jgi:NAD(P)H-hydrate epimerase